MLCRRHQIFGWWSLLVYLSLGIVLESLHGFKLGWYLGVDVETRRFMWTLAHAHGSLLALIQIAFSNSVSNFSLASQRSLSLTSLCLVGASILMPAGFFLGGVFFYSGDPGLGVLLVPPGAMLLLVAVFSIAMAATRSSQKPS